MARKNAKGYYFNRHPQRCQLCIQHLFESEAEAHHKIKRSLGGNDTLENMVILCGGCHFKLHLKAETYNAVRDSPANVMNGERIILVTS